MNEFEKKYYESASFWEGDILHDQQNIERFTITKDLINEDVITILDAGCGNGVFVNYLQEQENKLVIHALDRSETALCFVKTNKSIGDVSLLPFENLSFDCVTCLEVLEHLPIKVYEQTLKELTRVAKKYLIISVPYREVLEDSYTKCPHCKSIFNYELHLRCFNDNEIINLFQHLGFRNSKLIKAGALENYKFHKTYRKLFYPEQFLKWNSPICPLCGYEEEKKIKPSDAGKGVVLKPKRKLISYLTGLPKQFWPKEKKFYWIIGLFERV